MKKLSDQEIQDLLEKNQNHIADENTRLYSKVFEALNTEPQFELSPNFSAHVVSSIEAKSEKTEKIIYVIGILGILVSVILTLGLIVVFAGDAMVKYLPHLLIGSIVILIIQYLDKKVQHLVIRTK